MSPVETDENLCPHTIPLLDGHAIPIVDVPEATKTRVVLRASVSLSDVLASIRGEVLRRLELAVHELTEYGEDETDEERLVRALVEPELPDGTATEWFEPYLNHGLDELFSLIARLRVANHYRFASVRELWGLFRPFSCVDLDGNFERVSYDFWRSLCPVDSKYVVPLDCELNEPLPSATKAPSRCTVSVGDLGGLVDAVGWYLESLPNGVALRAELGSVGALAALAATFWTLAKKPELLSRRRPTGLRVDVFEKCLNSLRLGEHQELARRILVRNHPKHVVIDASGLDAIPCEWGGTLGIFEQRDHGMVPVGSL